MAKKSLIEHIIEHVKDPKTAEANDLTEKSIGRVLFTKSVTNSIMHIGGLGISIGIAALAGEVMDHVPYVSKAVPEAIKGLTNSEYFYGNLDKLGAVLGFVGYYFRKR